jgi:hypothetical protein
VAAAVASDYKGKEVQVQGDQRVNPVRVALAAQTEQLEILILMVAHMAAAGALMMMTTLVAAEAAQVAQ